MKLTRDNNTEEPVLPTKFWDGFHWRNQAMARIENHESPRCISNRRTGSFQVGGVHSPDLSIIGICFPIITERTVLQSSDRAGLPVCLGAAVPCSLSARHLS